MKKYIVFTAVFTLIGFQSIAQINRSGGVFLGYSTDINKIGIGVNAEFPVMEKLSIAPSFFYYFPEKEDGVSLNFLEFNANANYYFFQNEGISVYALGGLNLTRTSVSFEGSNFFGGGFSPSSNNVGLNLGAGANFIVSEKLSPFAEVKYVASTFGRLVIFGGVKINF